MREGSVTYKVEINATTSANAFRSVVGEIVLLEPDCTSLVAEAMPEKSPGFLSFGVGSS